MPKLSTITKPSGAIMEMKPSMVGRIISMPLGSVTVWWNKAESWLWATP